MNTTVIWEAPHSGEGKGKGEPGPMRPRIEYAVRIVGGSGSSAVIAADPIPFDDVAGANVYGARAIGVITPTDVDVECRRSSECRHCEEGEDDQET